MDIQAFALVAPMRALVDYALQSTIRHQPRRIVFCYDAIRQYMLCDKMQHDAVLAQLGDILSNVPATAAKVNLSWLFLLNGKVGPHERDAKPLTLRLVARFMNAVQCAPDTHSALRRRVMQEMVQLLCTLPAASLSARDCCEVWQVVAQCHEMDLCESLVHTLPLRETLEMQLDWNIAETLTNFCTHRRLAPDTSGSVDEQHIVHPTSSFLQDVVNNAARLEQLMGIDAAWHHCARCVQDAMNTRSQRSQGITSNILTSREAGTVDGARLVGPYERLMSSSVLLSMMTRRWATTSNPLPLRSLAVFSVYSLCMHLIALHMSVTGSSTLPAPSVGDSCVPASVRNVVQPALAADMWNVTHSYDLHSLVQSYLVTLVELEVELRDTVPLRRLLRECFVRAVQNNNNETLVKEGGNLGSKKRAYGLGETRGESALRVFFTGAVLDATTTPAHAQALRDLTQFLQGLLTSDVRCALRAMSHATESNDLLPLWLNWSVLNTVYVLIALELQLYKAAATDSDKQVNTTTTSDLHKLVDLCGVVLTPIVLRRRGCARAVTLLLLHAPQLTRQLGLHETCLALLQEHIMDGFTRSQLLALDGITARLQPDAPHALHTLLQHTAQQLPRRIY